MSFIQECTFQHTFNPATFLSCGHGSMFLTMVDLAVMDILNVVAHPRAL